MSQPAEKQEYNFLVQDMTADHVRQVLQDQYPGQDEAARERLVDHFLTLASLGEGVAGIDPETGLAFYIAGIRIQWPGRAETFSLGGTNGAMEPYRGGIAKFCAEQVAAWAAKHKLHRIDGVISNQDGKEAHMFMRALGFSAESVLRAYGPQGEDWTMYARLF